MGAIVLYEKAINYLKDIELLNSNLDLLINSKNNEEFENRLKELMKQLTHISLLAEYYDNQEYTKQFLIVETGVKVVDFSDIDVKIVYDYAFTRGNLLNNISCLTYKNEDYIPAYNAKGILEQIFDSLKE